MCYFENVEEFIQQVEYFVDVFLDYGCDVVLFLEFFNVLLMGLVELEFFIDVIWYLVEYIDEIFIVILLLVVFYNINVIVGFMLVIEDEELYNVSYLCKCDGIIEVQYKLYFILYEKKDWIMKGGNYLCCFDIDFGKIGILICYDVEFFEFVRVLFE